jgi:mRNA interferase RelE/StbE
MKYEITNKFYKDLKSINDKNVVEKVNSFINEIETSQNILELTETKKLKGFKNAYRKRINNYRIGFYLNKDNILLITLLKRADIYKKFP